MSILKTLNVKVHKEYKMANKIIGIALCAIIISSMIYGIATGNTGLPIMIILLIRLLIPFILKKN